MGDDGKNSIPVPGQLTPAELFEQEQAALLLDLGITSEYGVGRFSYCEVVPPKRARAADCWVEQLDYSLPLNKQPHHSAMLVVADLKRPEWDPEASKQDENWGGIMGKMAGAAAEGTMSAFSDLADTVQDYQDRDGHIEHVAGTIYPKKGDVEGDGSDHAGSLSDDTTPNEDEKTKKRRNPLKRISKKLASATTTSARSALRPRVPGDASGSGSAGAPSVEEGEEETGQESESSGASLSDHDQTPHANWKRDYHFDAVVGAETKRKSDAVSATSSVAPSEVGSRSGTKNNSKPMKGALVPGDGGYGDATPAASSKPEQRPTVDLPHFHGTSNLGRSRENRNAQVERLRRQLERQKDALRAKYKAQKAENKQGPVAGAEAGRGQKAMAGTAAAAGPAKAKAATGSGNQTQGNEKPAVGSSSRAVGSVDDIPKRGADGAATPPPRVSQADGPARPPPRVSQPANQPVRLVKRTCSGVNQRDGATADPAKEQTTTTGGKPKSVQEDPAAKQEAAAAAPKNPVVTVKKAAATNKREGATSAPTATNKTGPPPAASPKAAPVPDKLKQAMRGSAGAEAKPAQKADGGAPDAGKVMDDAKPLAAKTSVPAAAAVASPKPSAGVALATEGSTGLFYPATAVTSLAAAPGATPGAIPKPVAATSTKKTTEEPGAKVTGAEAGAAVMSPSPKPVAGAAEKPSEVPKRPPTAAKTRPPPATRPKAPVPDKLKQAVRGSAEAEAKPAQKADGGAPDAGKVMDDAKPKAAKTSVPAAAAVASPKPSAGVALATEAEGSTGLFYPPTHVPSVATTPGATPGEIPKPVAATSTTKTTEEPKAKVAGAEAGAAVMSPSPKPVAGAAEKPSEVPKRPSTESAKAVEPQAKAAVSPAPERTQQSVTLATNQEAVPSTTQAKPAKEETASTSTKTAEPFAKAAGPVPVAATPPGAAVQSVAPIQKTVASATQSKPAKATITSASAKTAEPITKAAGPTTTALVPVSQNPVTSATESATPAKAATAPPSAKAAEPRTKAAEPKTKAAGPTTPTPVPPSPKPVTDTTASAKPAKAPTAPASVQAAEPKTKAAGPSAPKLVPPGQKPAASTTQSKMEKTATMPASTRTTAAPKTKFATNPAAPRAVSPSPKPKPGAVPLLTTTLSKPAKAATTSASSKAVEPKAKVAVGPASDETPQSVKFFTSPQAPSPNQKPVPSTTQSSFKMVKPEEQKAAVASTSAQAVVPKSKAAATGTGGHAATTRSPDHTTASKLTFAPNQRTVGAKAKAPANPVKAADTRTTAVTEGPKK